MKYIFILYVFSIDLRIVYTFSKFKLERKIMRNIIIGGSKE
jgi:hypothetical protein